VEAARESESTAVDPDARARWPERLIELAREYRRSSQGDARDAALSEFWVLLYGALCKFLRVYGAQDVRDVASEKALRLVERMRDGRWEPEGSSAAQVHGFVSTVARNAVVDHARGAARREVAYGTSDELASRTASAAAAQEPRSDRSRYAVALLDCASHLAERVRRAWFLRVFHELPTKAIAAHPDVGMKPASLDVTLGRCRDRMRRCMQSKGFDPVAMPPGTFTVLWEALRR